MHDGPRRSASGPDLPLSCRAEAEQAEWEYGPSAPAIDYGPLVDPDRAACFRIFAGTPSVNSPLWWLGHSVSGLGGDDSGHVELALP
jgi:hypothetical protein